MKRIFDVLIAFAGLVVLLPVFILIAAAVAIEGKGPVLYMGRRVGLNGKLFRILKFRTMVIDAEKMGPGITSADDVRVTRVGRFLRRFKLDELPQLVNILRGDMSLVGPRPEDPRYLTLYTPAQMEILSVRPGITSPASLLYKNEESMLDGREWEEKYISEVMPAKLSIDLRYFRENSFSSDLRLVMRTIAEVFRIHGEGRLQ